MPSLPPLQLRSVLAFNVWERFKVRFFSAFGELGGLDMFHPTRKPDFPLGPWLLRWMRCVERRIGAPTIIRPLRWGMRNRDLNLALLISYEGADWRFHMLASTVSVPSPAAVFVPDITHPIAHSQN